MLALLASDPMDHVLPHRFGEAIVHWPVEWTSPLNILTFTPHDTYFTNHILMSIVAMAIMLLLFPRLGRRYAALATRGSQPEVPTGFAGAMEFAMAFIRDNVARPVLGERTDRFMPFLWTMFFYILLCNLLGMIPLDAIIGTISVGRLQHVGGTATGNIMITAGLACCSFLMIHFSGAREVYGALVAGTYGHHQGGDEDHAHHGEGHGHGAHASAHAHATASGGLPPVAAAVAAPLLYAWNFAPHVFAPKQIDGIGAALLCLADIVMWAILLALEALGAIIKAFALSIRLFANMVAGHVVLASILALVAGFKGFAMSAGGGLIVVLGCAALSCLELFVAFLQAYIFTFLTTLFIGASVSPEH